MQKEVALKDLTAVQTVDENSQILGNLFWFSVGKHLINVPSLTEKLKNSGVGENWLPNTIRPSDAFRRATKEAERRKVQTDREGIFLNYLIRDLYSDKDIVIRNIVIEEIDSKGKRLNYNPDACKITLDKTDNSIKFETTDAVTQIMAKEIEEKYTIYKDFYQEQQIRVVVSKILNSLSPIPVRKNGGIYFVPQKYEQQLKNLKTFCGSLENSEGYSIPVVNTYDNKEMISQKVKSHLESVLAQCRSVATTTKLSNAQIKAIIEEAKQAINDFNNYKGLINPNILSIELVEKLIQEIKSEIALMLERM